MSALERAAPRVDAAWRVLADVLDPEVPALSVVDLGIVRGIDALDSGALEVVLTPTYSGCPATEVIEANIVAALEEKYQITVKESEIAKIRTPADLFELVKIHTLL